MTCSTALQVILLAFGVCHVRADLSGGKDFESRPRNGSVEREKWAYVNVRPGAHIFWWLYETTHADGVKNRPLILWFQGGPGGSPVGYGNFELIGPLDVNLNPRPTTWQKKASLLFIDHPVGTGYSYCTRDDAYTTDNEQVARDLIIVMKSFLKDNPQYKITPIYVFGQSYGGKMAANFARRLQEAIDRKEIDCILRGFAMGNAWTHPVDSTITWAPFLYSMALVDEAGMADINNTAMQCKDRADRGHWAEATDLWAATQRCVHARTNYVDFYNILKFRVRGGTYDDEGHVFNPMLSPMNTMSLSSLMNGPIRRKLKIIPAHVTWGEHQWTVFWKHKVDFMKPEIDAVSEVLTKYDMKVIVYQGQLDLICDTIGAMDWVDKMEWPDKDKYYSAKRNHWVNPKTKQTEAFVKAYKKFSFYWLQKGGHSVPKDIPESSFRMLDRILKDVDK